MRTVAETSVFIRYADEVWSETERQEFITFIASSPEAGSVIRGSGGCRKVRWSRLAPESKRRLESSTSWRKTARSGFLSFTRRPVRQPANVIHRKAETGSPDAL